LEVLKEIAPVTTRATVIFNPNEFQSSGFIRVLGAAAPSLGVELKPAAVQNSAEIERINTALAHDPNQGIVVMTSPLTTVHRELIVTFAARCRLPAVYPYRFFTAIGGTHIVWDRQH
jgi:putative tryptophan/tyrosine transport system substrate-binding protein